MSLPAIDAGWLPVRHAVPERAYLVLTWPLTPVLDALCVLFVLFSGSVLNLNDVFVAVCAEFGDVHAVYD